MGETAERTRGARAHPSLPRPARGPLEPPAFAVRATLVEGVGLLALVLAGPACRRAERPPPADPAAILAPLLAGELDSLGDGGPAWQAEAEQAWQRGLDRRAAQWVLGRLRTAPEDARAQAWLLALVGRRPEQVGLSPAERDALVGLAPGDLDGRRDLDAAAWRAALAWVDLAEGRPAQALARVGSPSSPDLLGLSARLEAHQRLDLPAVEPAGALHLAWPTERAACLELGRHHRRRAELDALRELRARCEAAGALPELARMEADLLDLAGESGQACALYLQVGATVHAAAILLQVGDCPGAGAELLERLLADPSPEARLLRAWRSLGAAEPSARGEACDELPPEAGAVGPPYRAALAACALARSEPGEARAMLEGMGEDEPLLDELRAQVALALGEPVAPRAPAADPVQARLRLRRPARLMPRSGAGAASVLSPPLPAPDAALAGEGLGRSWARALQGIDAGDLDGALAVARELRDGDGASPEALELALLIEQATHPEAPGPGGAVDPPSPPGMKPRSPLDRLRALD